MESLRPNDRYVIKRASTYVSPVEVEHVGDIKKALSVVFICWSLIIIICYFAGISIPDYIDISVSLTSIFVSISYFLYKQYMYRSHKLGSISPAPIVRDRKRGIIPIINKSDSFVNLEDIKLDI